MVQRFRSYSESMYYKNILQISWIEQDLKKSLVYKVFSLFTHWYTCRQLVVPNTVLSAREFFIAHNVYYPSLTNHSQWGRHYRWSSPVVGHTARVDP